MCIKTPFKVLPSWAIYCTSRVKKLHCQHRASRMTVLRNKTKTTFRTKSMAPMWWGTFFYGKFIVSLFSWLLDFGDFLSCNTRRFIMRPAEASRVKFESFIYGLKLFIYYYVVVELLRDKYIYISMSVKYRAHT